MLGAPESKGVAAIGAARSTTGRELGSPREWPQTFRLSVAGRIRAWALGMLWLVAAMVILRSGAVAPGAVLMVVAGIYLRGALLKSAAYVVTPDLLEVRSPDGKKERHPLAGASIERRKGRTGARRAILTSPKGVLVLNEGDPGIAPLTATLDALIHNRPAPPIAPPRYQLPPPLDKVSADTMIFGLAIAGIAALLVYRWLYGVPE